MRIYLLLVLGFICLGQLEESWARAERRSCARPQFRVPRTTTQYRPFLQQNNIVQISRNIQPRDLVNFIYEFTKLPPSLLREAASTGARVHLLHGTGVAQDPSWTRDPKVGDPDWDNRADTFDGRSWRTVPGSGGYRNTIPTRIVVNRLYEGHGSINLVLHEHAHTLDSLYELRGVSNSRQWRQLHEAEETRNFLDAMATDYEKGSREESFAELFAYYHACNETRWHMRWQAPNLAAFFEGFTSVREHMARDLLFSLSPPDDSALCDSGRAPAGAAEGHLCWGQWPVKLWP